MSSSGYDYEEKPRGSAGRRPELGVYIHIPFCRQKCLYCDFPSSANAEHLFDDYIAALCREIAGKGGVLSAYDIDTVYFGGGTPTVLPASGLSLMLACLRRHGNIRADAEITVEANPGTLSGEKLALLRAAGVTRLSIGVQAFDDSVLAAAGRIHTADQAASAVSEAAAWFDNISVDLMYGLPGQSLAKFRAGLGRAAELPVRHLSVYGLKVEEGTPFSELQAAGRLRLPSEDEEAAMYELTADLLPDKGFRRYEISNYARAGFECRHNLKYWRYDPYVGFGAAAHSFLQGERSANITDVNKYIDCLAKGGEPVDCREKPDRSTAIAEYIFLALRTAAGLSISEFNNYFKDDFMSLFGAKVEKLIDQELLAIKRDNVCLTKRGMKYGNLVFTAFLPDV